MIPRHEVNFPAQGKVIAFRLKQLKSVVFFYQSLPFMGRQAISSERESHFEEEAIPQREIFPLAQCSPGGKVLPLRMLGNPSFGKLEKAATGDFKRHPAQKVWTRSLDVENVLQGPEEVRKWEPNLPNSPRINYLPMFIACSFELMSSKLDLP